MRPVKTAVEALSLQCRRGVLMVPAMLHRLAIILSLAASLHSVKASRGAVTPWTTYEAEDMTTTGVRLGPNSEPNLVETESSGTKYQENDSADFTITRE